MRMTNNKVNIVGRILKPWTYDHTTHGERFYMTYITISRFSGVKDEIPVVLSERLASSINDCVVQIKGEFHSRSYWDENKRRIQLFVLAEDIECVKLKDLNSVQIIGTICKPPVLRATSTGRKICDVILAVNRLYGKSDYIPCIFWGRSAEYVSALPVGTRLKTSGRIQSREYKKITDKLIQIRVAYEISTSELEVIEEGIE